MRHDGDAAWIRAGQRAWGEEGGFGRDVASRMVGAGSWVGVRVRVRVD